MLAWRTPSDREVCFFFNARVTSWLPARVFGIRQEGVIPFQHLYGLDSGEDVGEIKLWCMVWECQDI